MKKIAFLFLTKLNLNKYKIWIEYLKNQEDKYNIYVHPYQYFYSTKQKVTNELLKNNIIDNIVKTDYFHIYNAIIELYRESIKNKDNYKFIILSESDIPITSFNVLYSFLTRDTNAYVKYRESINKNEYINRIKLILKETNFISKDDYISHEAWFCLNKYHVLTILKAHYKYNYIFSKMNIGNEHYLTILWHQKQNKNIKNKSIIYNNWEYTEKKYNKIQKKLDKLYFIYDKDKTNFILKEKIDKLKIKLRKNASHPKTYKKNLLKKDMTDILKSKSFFARKFDKNSNIDLYWKYIVDCNNKQIKKLYNIFI
jgi:hypothetical protein